MQEALNEYGAIIWTDSTEYFITTDIDDILKTAEKVGLAAWTIESEEPTSALTHPKMFTHFHTRQDAYLFHRMVGSEHLVIYNTARVHRELMLRWVECALTLDCIWPIGAQNVGCNYQRKPLFRYSGCHKYEVSALNVILGLVFTPSEQPYTVKQKVFGREDKIEGADNTTLKHSTRGHAKSEDMVGVGASK